MTGANPYYITTPIYYVNGRPHIGHAYTTIAADASARYQRMKGRPTFFLTGTDEHGQKVLDKAIERGMTPQAHVDDMVTHWKAMWDRLDVKYDHFIRTTDAGHIRCVKEVLQHLWDNDQIYLDTYEGWYSTSAERFWTEKDLVDGKCPDTGQPVVKIEESNYFFKMGSYQEQLIAHIDANPGFILPESRRNEVLGFLRKPLGDLCISRPKSRMGWGIELPFDADYVTYVWFDALLNYVSHIGYHPGDEGFKTWWPASHQLIGKDILTTHAVYWSTMLMALGEAPPKTLYAHGWWKSHDGAKMSKSLGNAIDIALLADEFGVDATRYFFLREIGFGADGGFSYEGFQTRYNADLANDLGNLAHRGLSMTTNWLGGVVPARGTETGHEAALAVVAAEAIATFDREMEDLQFNKALEGLFTLVRAGNKYIDDTQPWALNKTGDVESLKTVMRTVLEILVLAASFMAPVTPAKSAELLLKLGRTPEQAAAAVRALLAGEARPLELLSEGAQLEVGDPLFPRFKTLPDNIQAIVDAAAASPDPEPKKKKKRSKKAEPPAEITFEDFAKVALRVGVVLSAEGHPDADRLLVLQVDIGEEKPRQIVAGIANRFSPEELVGKSVVVVANLAPADLRGVMSEGMLLAAGGKKVVDLVSVEADPGEVVR